MSATIDIDPGQDRAAGAQPAGPGQLAGRRGLVLGVVNQRSIGWLVAHRLAAEGAVLGLTYHSQRAGEWLRRATAALSPTGEPAYVGRCDVRSDADLTRVCAEFADRHGPIDFLVHAVAHADRADLAAGLTATSRTGFGDCMETSVYSLIALVREATPLFAESASVLTMSYLGGERVCYGYDLLGVAKAALESTVRYLAAELGQRGVRVNALSSGPVRTLATFGLPNFSSSLAQRSARSPLGRPVGAADLAGTALYLVSDLSSGVTGEVVHVDAGYHIMGTWAGDDANG
jgi:enoyl-[acyl-carrier protein] reductase I